MNERVPAQVFSPGEYLSDELEARGWTQVDFAAIIGRTPALVSQIVHAKRSVTPDLAKEFAAALGTSAMVWLNLESAYRLHADPDPIPAKIVRHARLRERFPVREMVKRNWIAGSSDAGELEKQVFEFFGINELNEIPTLSHAAKKTGYPEDLNSRQLAWLFRVKQIASGLAVPPYSEKRLRSAVDELRTLLLVPEGVQQVPRILAECGVRFLIVEHVASSKIDGVCFWQVKSPVIGMSLRLDKIDNFWFVLRHEIEHVLRKHGREEAVVDIDSEEVPTSPNDEENAANWAGADFCVPDEEMADFILRNDPLFSEEDVLNFAWRMQVHPGLVVGQLQRRTGNYKLFRRHLERIRHLVASVAITDGYGHVVPQIS
jgi:HTH-type transcriptional regulator/antitoxin HigA